MKRHALIRSGFTLVEVLAAVALLVLLAAAVMSFLSVLRDRQKTVGDAYDRQRSLALVMERLDAEVITCFADSGEGEAGISGTESQLKIGSRGVGLGLLGAESLQVSSTQFSSFGLSGSEFRVSRQEQTGVSPVTLTVRGVGKVRFRYHDGSEWRTTFDSQRARGLPMAIEVSVWFAESLQEPAAATEVIESEASDAVEPAEVIEVPPDRVRIFAIPDGVRSGGVPGDSAPPSVEGASS